MTDLIEGTIEQRYGSFLRQEPAVLTHLITGPALGLATLFGAGDPSSSAQQITAGAVAAAVLVQGFVVRRWVAPAWKRHTGRDFPTEVVDEPDPEPDDDQDDDVALAPRHQRPSPQPID